MITDIKNRHLRRLALLLWAPITVALLPVFVLYEYAPEWYRDLFEALAYFWNKP